MFKRLYILFIYCLSFVNAQDLSGYGSFLLIGPSARATSLGNTMHSVIESPAALFFNPANLGFTNSLNFYTNRSTNEQYFGNYQSFGLLIPIKQINLGIAGSYLTIGEIENYTSEAVYQGSFNSTDYGLIMGISYSHRNMSWGLSAKYMSSKFSLENTDRSEAYGIDIGFTSKNLNGKIPLIIGFNISRSFANKDGMLLKEYVPSRATLGLQSLLKINKLSFSPYLDLIVQETRLNTLNWGLSADYRIDIKNLTKASIFLGQRGYYLENSASISKSELNQIPKRFNLGFGGQFEIGKTKLIIDYSHNISDYYIKRNFFTLSIIF